MLRLYNAKNVEYTRIEGSVVNEPDISNNKIQNDCIGKIKKIDQKKRPQNSTIQQLQRLTWQPERMHKCRAVEEFAKSAAATAQRRAADAASDDDNEAAIADKDASVFANLRGDWWCHW